MYGVLIKHPDSILPAAVEMENAKDNRNILNKLCFILFKVSISPVPTYHRMPKLNMCLKLVVLSIIFSNQLCLNFRVFNLLGLCQPWTSEFWTNKALRRFIQKNCIRSCQHRPLKVQVCFQNYTKMLYT